MNGVLLQLLHPEVADRDCDHCLKYLYDEKTGEPIKSRKKDGSLRKRDSSCPSPCRTSVGCKKGTPENSRALNRTNREAWEHYQECRAVGAFPDDPVVRRNAALIREAEQIHERIRDENFRETLIRVAAAR